MNPWSKYLCAVVLVCAGAYMISYSLAVSPIFCAYSQSFADVAPCYKYDVRGKATDALLVGDSSLLYGIRPSLIKQATGISTYNFGMQGPAFSFDPQSVIDRFLDKNSKPHFIVVYLSPWNHIVLHQLTDPQWFPLAVLALRHRLWREFAYLVSARPSVVAEIPQILAKSIGLSRVPAKNWRAQMERDNGYFDYASTLSNDRLKIGVDCHHTDFGASPTYAADNRQSLNDLRQHYQLIGLRLFVYVAPTAECDEKLDIVRQLYNGVSDNQPASLKDYNFANDTPMSQHSHMNSKGAEAASTLFAEFLKGIVQRENDNK